MHTLKAATVVVLLAVSLASFAAAAAAACSTVTTFNAAMTPRVGDYWNRRSHISDALAAEGADVLCLQEFWFEDDMRHVIDDLKGMYPHHFSAIHTGPNKLEDDTDTSSWWEPDWAQSACSASELLGGGARMLACAWREDCFSVLQENAERGMACLAQKCGDVFRSDSISPECISCLVISSSSISDISDRCHKVFGSDLRLNQPGLLLLSKKPLGSPQYASYFPEQDQTLHRGYIQTQIADVGTVVCTHFTSVFPNYLEYDLPFGSYAEQSRVEINATYARLGTTDHILAADLNTGKAVSNNMDPEKDLGAEAPESFALLEHYGYKTNQYLDDDGRCTYCEANEHVSNYNLAIDDVLVMGDAFSTVTKQRVLDQTNPFLSDHYGVRARLCTS